MGNDLETVDYGGSKGRRNGIGEYRRLGYDQWVEKKRYGMRWVATEGVFSAVKRKFGESMVSRNDLKFDQ